MKNRNKDRFSLQFANPEKLHVHEAKLSNDTLKALGLGTNEKTHIDYFTEYIGKKELDKIFSLFNNLTHKSITGEQKKVCSKCGENPPDKTATPLCEVLGREGSVNFYFAGWEFIRIVNANHTIFKDKEQVKRLTRSFFTCFHFHEGHVYFELKELGMKCLKEGLISISSILAGSPVFERFRIINDSLLTLRNEYRYYKLDYDAENEFLKNHIEWYEDQERFYMRNEEIKEKYDSQTSEDQIAPEDTNPYPSIFKDKQAFDFFTELLEVFELEEKARIKTPYSDITDIYVLMCRDRLILETFKPQMYVNWLNENYPSIPVDRLITVSNRTVPVFKLKIYQKSKDVFYKNL